MQENSRVKLEQNGAIVARMPNEDNKAFNKVRTVKSNELNFYIPEKWNYDQII